MDVFHLLHFVSFRFRFHSGFYNVPKHSPTRHLSIIIVSYIAIATIYNYSRIIADIDKHVSACMELYSFAVPYSGGKFGELTRFEQLAKESLAN